MFISKRQRRFRRPLLAAASFSVVDETNLKMNFPIGKDSENQELVNTELEELRKKLRETKFAHREKQRELLVNKIRYVQDVNRVDNINLERLVELAKKLKRKSLISNELLRAISNAFLDNTQNIEAFLSVDGALQALLRCLSGHNEEYQLLAARCICNLALGNEKLAYQVLKASDSYLIAHLSGRNYYVMEACAVAVGNFSSHGSKHVNLLLIQGICSKITQLLNIHDEILESSCIYALTQLVYKGFDIIGEDDLLCICNSMVGKFQEKSFLIIFLMSVLSARPSCLRLFHSHRIHFQALNHFLVALRENEKESVYYLRVIGNCLCQESGDMARDLIQNCSSLLDESLRLCLECSPEYLKRECLALLGSLLNHSIGFISDFGLKVFKENFSVISEYMQTTF